MNYIKQLECQVIETNERVIGMLERIGEFQHYLATSKFDRPNDYIYRDDVLRWMRYIDSGLN